MRITNNLIISKFSRSLNRSAINLSDATERVSSGRKFSRASQNPADAMKSFKIRQGLSRIELYQSNINDVTGQLDQAETALMDIYNIIVQAKENLIQSSNGTMSEGNRATVASIFENLRDQIFKLGNTSFAGRYIFGGPNTTELPFSIQSGKLFYNGTDVDDPSVSTEEIFVDMGLGLTLDSTGELQKSTAFSISTPGSIALGHGIDQDGLPNNIYNLLGNIAADLKNDDMTMIDRYIEKLTESADNVMVSVAGIGEKIKFVEFINDRLDTDKLNLQKKQGDLEYENYAEALIEYNGAEFTYTAAMKMGAKIIQKSLLDFLQ
ncbi:MAG: hypothetical protein GX303_08730 [Clostridiales bacterium]|nr:hypothetical protein [Clostridiales bacterium]